MNLADLGAVQLVQMIRDGETTSTELVKACLERIEERENSVQAWQHLDPEFALKQARQRDEVKASGQPLGALHGIPVGIKDIFDTKDYPTENGTVLDAGREPLKDCMVVSLLKAEGAVIMGKTVTTEMAVFSPGKTRNPHDETRTPGGSSSGSAAAVASGMVPLALGTQTKGSVIRPASFCGTVGYKPTHGRIPRTGALLLSRILDHVGVFARSLEDVALISECLMVDDMLDPDTEPRAHPRLTEILNQPPAMTPRIAFVKTPMWDQADAQTKEAFAEIATELGENCQEITLPDEFGKVIENIETIMTADLARFLDKYMQRGADKISDVLRGMILAGQSVTAVDYNRAVDEIQPLRDWLGNLLEDYDAVMTPAAIGEAPKGLDKTGDPVFCSIWTYLGVPALSLPMLEGLNGMPIGVQLVGASGDDARLLRTARWLIGELSADD